EARKNTVLPSWQKLFFHPDAFEKIASVTLKIVSNYGRDLRLPLFWLGISAFSFYRLYNIYGGLECISEPQLAGWVREACTGDLSLLFT
ncbi:hypothetical protein NL349_27680, partial [Klebsiella pneumoniae]|nr:hypothetical protein [Klebsiella pneumoniae]